MSKRTRQPTWIRAGTVVAHIGRESADLIWSLPGALPGTGAISVKHLGRHHVNAYCVDKRHEQIARGSDLLGKYRAAP